VGADADQDGGGDQVALVAGQVEPDPLGVLGAHRREHGLEVAQRPGREAVALGGVDVEVVERLQVLTDRDLDALLGRLLDVAAPELVHAPEQVVLGPAGQWNLIGELRLPGPEAVLRALRQRAGVPELAGHAGADRVGLLAGHLGEPLDARVGRIIATRAVELVSRVVSLRPKWYTFASGEDWPPEGGTGIDR
jgi:hypothetical protein